MDKNYPYFLFGYFDTFRPGCVVISASIGSAFAGCRPVLVIIQIEYFISDLDIFQITTGI